MTDVEWAQTLKVGDEVAVSHYGFGRAYSLQKVVRITETQIVVTAPGAIKEYRVRKSDCKVLGNRQTSSHASQFIRQATQEIRDKIAHAELSGWIESLGYQCRQGKRVPLSALRAMREAFVRETEKLGETEVRPV